MQICYIHPYRIIIVSIDTIGFQLSDQHTSRKDGLYTVTYLCMPSEPQSYLGSRVSTEQSCANIFNTERTTGSNPRTFPFEYRGVPNPVGPE